MQTFRRAVSGWQLEQRQYDKMAPALVLKSPVTQQATDLSLSVYVDVLIKMLVSIRNKAEAAV